MAKKTDYYPCEVCFARSIASYGGHYLCRAHGSEAIKRTPGIGDTFREAVEAMKAETPDLRPHWAK